MDKYIKTLTKEADRRRLADWNRSKPIGDRPALCTRISSRWCIREKKKKSSLFARITKPIIEKIFLFI